MKRRRPLWAWLFLPQLALVVVASVLATTGHFPVAVFQRSPFDKIGHLAVYGALAFFAVGFFGRGRCASVIIGLLVAATLEEVSQSAFPTRTFDVGDLAMNIIGISVFGAASAALGGGRSSTRGCSIPDGPRRPTAP